MKRGLSLSPTSSLLTKKQMTTKSPISLLVLSRSKVASDLVSLKCILFYYLKLIYYRLENEIAIIVLFLAI
jgi:predicted XRE-type DNA-binding protein